MVAATRPATAGVQELKIGRMRKHVSTVIPVATLAFNLDSALSR